ncbi:MULTISPECIES: serine/threonine-protein kinase [unclassified Streptomyces]|uniref:serine/threonine-protein kinase n=1 Tax=unclassified Streptomyces TaxID=2593676 RepID=UPI0006F84E06|nr:MULTISPECIES: serine/threonine-protein kinase [unclassified Streptomyces]KQX50827.1 serine/threonine protein phosphatase [Streptomyces sp. Root1304]KRA84992.1 serine/threonine protein phosphatase [Streptomyces sp. Root66D1]
MTGANGADLVGEVLGGRYRVTAMIGRGGMGVVARAVDQLLNREVAVKVLRAYTDASPADLTDLRVRMQREAQAAARIRHSGVVTVHDVVEERGLPVIVMELVEGPSLDDVLAERGSLDPREVAAIGAKLMDALDAAHRAGVLHRDVKPGNVLLERGSASAAEGFGGGRVVLTDFGIASMETPGDEALAKLTQSGQIVGSLDYLPPERAQGQVPGAASDIWALGMTLYAAVEGAAPFRRTSVWSTLAAIVGEPLPEPRRAGPLAPVLRALMAKDPLQRPDAGQAREMLQAVAEGADPAVAQAQAPAPAPAPQPVTPPPPGFGPGFGPAFGSTPPPSATPPGFGPAVDAPLSPPAPQHHAPSMAAGGYAAPPSAYAAPQGVPSGMPAEHHGPSDTRATSVRARRRRTRTVVAVAAATVLTCGGVAYALMGTRDAEGGGPDRALPGASATTAGEGSEAGGGPTDRPTPPGDLTSFGPGGSPSGSPRATPSRTPRATLSGTAPAKGGDHEPGVTPTPGDGSAEPTGAPSTSPKATPSATVKEPTPVSRSCTGWAHSNRSDGAGRAAQNTHLYTGPYAKCSYVTAIDSGTKIYYHCYVTNADANKWIYARIAGTDTEGWVYGEKSTLDSGSLARC